MPQATTAIRGNSLYRVVTGTSWTDAEAESVTLGGHLVAINDWDEFSWLSKNVYGDPEVINGTVPNKPLEVYFIGLNDAEMEETYVWSNGDPTSGKDWADIETVFSSQTGLGLSTDDYFVIGSNNDGRNTPIAAGTNPWDVRDGQATGFINVDNASSFYKSAFGWNHYGIAEIPLNLSITLPTTAKEGAGPFTTSINLTAGTQNLTEGLGIYWKVTGITEGDLKTGSLTGSGTITNGKLDIQHSLIRDADKGEKLEVSVFSNAEMTEQIGATASVEIQEGEPIIRGNSLYRVIDGPSWTEAEASSVALGGHLVAITSQEENLWLHQNIISLPRPVITSYFIGLTDSAQEGVPVWSSGEERVFDYFYGNQVPNSPDDYFVVNSDGNGAPPPVGNEVSGWINVDETASFYRAGLSPDVSTDIKAIAEIPLNLSITLPTTPKEGAGVFTTTINLSAGTQTTGNLAEGAAIYWKVTGITADDLDSGDLTGTGVITNGRLDIQHSLKTDADKGETLEVSVFSNAEMTEQIGTTASVEVQEADPVFKVGTSTSNASPISISGSSGPGTMAGVEALTTTRVNLGTARRPRWVNQTSYTAIDRFTEVDGITFTGGSAANNITAAGVTGDPLRPTFNGQLIADGGLSTDTITGGTYRNWLIGGGIFSGPQTRRTTSADNLIGTRGALDVFDLRTSTFTADAYSATNSGSASITNYTKGEDHIVLSGAQTAYRITAQTRTSGRGRNATTVTTGYQIFSGAELVASVAPASGTGFTGTAATDLNILYGQQGDPTQTLINGESLFFG